MCSLIRKHSSTVCAFLFTMQRCNESDISTTKRVVAPSCRTYIHTNDDQNSSTTTSSDARRTAFSLCGASTNNQDKETTSRLPSQLRTSHGHQSVPLRCENQLYCPQLRPSSQEVSIYLHLIHPCVTNFWRGLGFSTRAAQCLFTPKSTVTFLVYDLPFHERLGRGGETRTSICAEHLPRLCKRVLAPS